MSEWNEIPQTYDRGANIRALCLQVLGNLNLRSILDIIRTHRTPDVVNTVRTRLSGSSTESWGENNKVYFEGCLLGGLETWEVSELVPRINILTGNNHKPLYEAAGRIFSNIGSSKFSQHPDIIVGPTADGRGLNNGLEVLGREYEHNIPSHKGGMVIDGNGNMGVFLPEEKAYVRYYNDPDTIMIGTSLAFEVPQCTDDPVSIAMDIIESQGYLYSSGLRKGFLAFSPYGEIRYHNFTGMPGSVIFDNSLNVGDSVLSMIISEEPGTRICALEESYLAKFLNSQDFSPDNVTLYFYAY